MKVWDPHFHIWDVRPNSPSGHDSAQLFAPDDDPIYTIKRYEADLRMQGFELIGGTLSRQSAYAILNTMGLCLKMHV